MFSKAAESKHQNTFQIKFRFDIEVSLLFFTNKIQVFYTLGQLIYTAVHEEENMVLNDPLSHEQIPAGETGASTSGDSIANEGFASSPNNKHYAY